MVALDMSSKALADCACNEFMGLHLSKLMGVNVPDARLMLPKHGDKYEVAIEFIASDTLPDYERIRHNAFAERICLLPIGPLPA